jgi:cytoskeletal protein RodZ
LPAGRNVRWLIPVTALIVVVVFVLVGLWSWHRFRPSSRNIQAPASAVSAMMALTDAMPVHASASANTESAPPQVTVKQDGTAAAGTKLHLHMQLVQPSWVEVYGPDDKRLYYNLATAGSELDFHADKGSLRVYLGNAAGVKLEVNGKDFQIPASDVSGHTARFKLNADTASPMAGTAP